MFKKPRLFLKREEDPEQRSDENVEYQIEFDDNQLSEEIIYYLLFDQNIMTKCNKICI